MFPPGPEPAARAHPPVHVVDSRPHLPGPGHGVALASQLQAAIDVIGILSQRRVVHFQWPCNANPATTRGDARPALRSHIGDGRRGVALAPSRRPSPVEDESAGAGELHITRPVLEEVLDALTSRPPEAGGMLLGPRNHHAVTHFVLDEHGRATSASFTLDHVGLNRALRRYTECGIDMKGFVHSHPDGCPWPSTADFHYVLRTFANPRNAAEREFLIPIVCGGEFYPYIVTRDEAPGSEVVIPARLVVF